MQTSGLVLDVYDDFGGAVLRELYPSFNDIPGQVKQAHIVTADDRQRLPDDVFALVMVNEGEKLRKFACIDEGNTVLSVEYFLKNAHKLPVEAQRVAAENLKVACSWYDLPIPEELSLFAEEKTAGIIGAVGKAAVNRAVNDPLGTAMTAVTLPSTIKGTANTIKDNMAANRALQAQTGNAVVTPQQRNEALGRKIAEATGTPLMPYQGPADPAAARTVAKTVVNKTAMIGRLVSASKGDSDVPPDLVHPPTHEQPGQHPQAAQMRPTVDVSAKEPPKKVVEKKASIYALPTQQKYPLDNYAQVKAASAYFDTYVKHMPPPARHEYAVNLVKRAETLSVPVSDTARKYGAEDFAPEQEIKAAFDARRIEVAHNEDALELLGAVEKVARFRMWKEASASAVQQFTADQVVALLAEFDKVAGLDHHYDRSIPDPYFSVYGFEKEAQEPEFSEVIGNEMVTEADLKRLARIGAFSVKTTFGEDFQEEFLKDPVAIFKSLPLDQKKMLMRMANGTQPGAERTYY